MLDISIIIPVKPGGAVQALGRLHELDYPPSRLEVLVAEGCQPSRQRNLAARQAVGDILYFLDDDSLVERDSLRRLAQHYEDPAIVAVGGPSLTPASDSPLQRAIGAVLASPIGGVRNRYRRHGKVRKTDDSELILCNLSFRREDFLASGGLDERLYPNEENELLARLQEEGRILLHDPDLAIHRSQRPTLRLFLRQFFTYGRGRAEQTLLSGKIKPITYIPAVFDLYLLVCLAFPSKLSLLPLACYGTIVSGVALALGLRAREFGLGLRALLLIPLLHSVYGAGLVLGMLSPRYRSPARSNASVEVRRVKTLGTPWPLS